MSVATLNQQEIKALDQTRQRLSQLSQSLLSLQQQILQSDPLPPWSTLQSVAAIISQNLASVSQQLNAHHDLFAAMSIYPTPEYPGQTQESLLGILLRKRLEPQVEDWVDQGREIAIESMGQGINADSQRMEVQDLWSWAGMAANEQARKHTWGGNYTLEEKEMGVEKVVTGLRRKLRADPDDSASEDEDEEAVEEAPDGDEMDIVSVHRKSTGAGLEFDLTQKLQHQRPETEVNALPLNDIFRFMMTGVNPPRG